jgi:aminoglycoside phosphotransferase family enzyme
MRSSNAVSYFLSMRRAEQTALFTSMVNQGYGRSSTAEHSHGDSSLAGLSIVL